MEPDDPKLGYTSVSTNGEEGLIGRLKEGCEEAFRLVYRSYEASLLRYLQANGVSRADAEEVIQETFLTLYAKRGSLNGNKGSLGAYVFAIAVRKRYKLHRARRWSRLFDSGLHDQPVTDVSIASLPERLQVEKGLARLPDLMREPLVLFEINGFDYQEIGTILGIPIGTVRSRISRAREKLFDSMSSQQARGKP